MAATISVAAPTKQAINLDGVRGRLVKLAFTAADYATGGYAVTPAAVGLNEIYGAFIAGVDNAAITTGVYWQWNTTTGKLQAFVSNGASPAFLNEAPAATDLSAQKVRLLVFGV